MNEKPSLTKAADSLFVLHLANAVTSKGSVAFNGLEKGNLMEDSSRQANSVYPAKIPPAAEAKDMPPVASGTDEDFTIVCSWCGWMQHFGRGPVSHNICNPCRIEFFPEVPLG